MSETTVVDVTLSREKLQRLEDDGRVSITVSNEDDTSPDVKINLLLPDE